MGSIITIAVVAFIALMILAGYKRGLIKMAFSLVSIVVILLLVQVLSPTAKTIIKSTPVYDSVRDQIAVYVDKNITDAAKGITQAGESSQESIIKALPLPKSTKTSLIDNNTSKGYQSLGVNSFSDYVSAFLTNMLLSAITFVLLFIIITILIRVLMHALDIVAKLPIIRWFNKGGGALIGMAEAVIILWIVCIIVTMCSTTEWGQQVSRAIDNSVFLSLIYDNNIIQNVLTGIFKI